MKQVSTPLLSQAKTRSTNDPRPRLVGYRGLSLLSSFSNGAWRAVAREAVEVARRAVV